MNRTKENSFLEMSESFQKAYGYGSNGHYRQSIPLYEKCIEADKHNFAALNNLAIAKIYVGIEEQKLDLIQSGITHLNDAISITKEVYKFPDGYPIAESNLNWAEKEYKSLTETNI